MGKRQPVVAVRFSNGFGNNLFQYVYARLIADSHSGTVVFRFARGAEYAARVFKELGISVVEGRCLPGSVRVSDKNASTRFYGREFDNIDFNLVGYFENFNLYVDFHIKSSRLKKT